MPGLHHVEIWVTDLARARAEWGWLLGRLGFTHATAWDEGESWEAGGSYVTLTTSPNISADTHDRRRPGVNHLAFRVDTRQDADAIMFGAEHHGWRALYAERYPHAGGPDHYAGWLENTDGFKAEIVAASTS